MAMADGWKFKHRRTVHEFPLAGGSDDTPQHWLGTFLFPDFILPSFFSSMAGTTTIMGQQHNHGWHSLQEQLLFIEQVIVTLQSTILSHCDQVSTTLPRSYQIKYQPIHCPPKETECEAGQPALLQINPKWLNPIPMDAIQVHDAARESRWSKILTPGRHGLSMDPSKYDDPVTPTHHYWTGTSYPSWKRRIWAFKTHAWCL